MFSSVFSSYVFGLLMFFSKGSEKVYYCRKTFAKYSNVRFRLQKMRLRGHHAIGFRGEILQTSSFHLFSVAFRSSFPYSVFLFPSVILLHFLHILTPINCYSIFLNFPVLHLL